MRKRYRTNRGKHGRLFVSSVLPLAKGMSCLSHPLHCAIHRAQKESEEASKRWKEENLGQDGDKLTIIPGSLQLEWDLESQILLCNSLDIDMPDSTWVGDYRLELDSVD